MGISIMRKTQKKWSVGSLGLLTEDDGLQIRVSVLTSYFPKGATPHAFSFISYKDRWELYFGFDSEIYEKDVEIKI